jgi:translation elongation factor P/translation initiation factor 5A
MSDFKKGMTVICTAANYKVPTTSSKASSDSAKYLPFKNKDIKEGKIKVPTFRQKLTIRDVVTVGKKVGLLFEEIKNPEFEYNMIDGKEVEPFMQELLFDSINFQLFSSRVVKR